jgi:serine/threonine protein kinase
MDDKDRQGDGPKRCLGGRFDLLDRVGVGGGAVVVRARDRQLHRLVAVKLLRSRDPDLQRRFAQESEVLASLDHPAIVRVLAHDSEGEEPYTVLELIEGPDLGEHLAGSGPLPWRQVLQIGIQIADALDAAHRHGLVHRDVKPANIMFADADDRLQVKLIDFGIVRITENYRVPTGATPRRQTGMGKALGTPGYLPLEAGLVAPNPSFDVFGLGATLYQLLTGKLPEEPLLPLREAHPGCDAPDDLELVLAAALALEPEDRTQTAAELGRALAAVGAAHPDRSAPSKRIDGRYELIGLAGTGAKADAYLAVHRGTGHDVVLKFLRSKDPDEILRFTREAMLLQTFGHPALPRFYDHAPEASPPYIAMAHAPGRPASRLCSPPRLRPNEVAAVGVKLAEVLAVVHARGVLHRDINANNVLIDERGAVTLLDFGAAELDEGFYNVPAGERRYLTPPEARVVIPHGGIGTLAWSAPEVRGGSGWTDRSDVYSMGHLLFRLLTGKVPVKGADPPTSPQVYASACPEDLASAVVCALQVDPRHRPSAAQFAQTLLEVLESEEEALARAVVVALPAGRPSLRLVPTGPHAPADWTQHPIPDETSEPATLAALTERPVVAKVSAAEPSHTPRLAWTAAVALVALVVAWWGMQRPAVERASHSTLATNVDPSGRPTPVLPAAGQSQTPRNPAPALPMRDVLEAATPALRHCSELAHGLLIVDFTTVQGGDTFAQVSASVSDSPALDECVREATVDLRFRPQHAETVTKEYTP